jgi:hypothetical protein
MRAVRGWRALLQLIAVIAAECLAIVFLHRLGNVEALQVDWSDPMGWVRLSQPEDVLLAVCRLAAIACAYWLIGGTLLYTLARATRIPAAIRAVQWAALPPVRRLADRAIAVALATSSVVTGAGGMAWADAPTAGGPLSPPPVVDVVPAPHDPAAPADPYRPTPAGEPETGTAGVAPTGTPTVAGVYFPGTPDRWSTADAMPTPVIAEERPPAVSPPSEHVVVPGDDLWSIAAGHLAATLEVPLYAVPPDALAGYWRSVIDANRGNIASGDPDLLFPGEVLVLPPAPAPA